MALRWNLRIGPLQFTSPVGLIGGSFLAGMVLCCCGAGIVAAFSDTPVSPPPVPVVETVDPTPTAEPEPTEAEETEPAEQIGDRPVTAGAFCDTAGETGQTVKGVAMVCRGPGDLRWRRPL